MGKMLDRIKKLLNLATSTNEHEAQIAAQKANELLVKNNLSMSDVSISNIIESGQEELPYVDPLRRSVFGILIKHFFVEIILQATTVGYTKAGQRKKAYKVIFIGREHNVQVAQYVNEVLTSTFKQLWLSYKKEHGLSEKARMSYILGLKTGLSEKLQQTRTKVENETGLVVVKDSDLVNHLKQMALRKAGNKTTSVNGSHFDRGMSDGKSININKGMSSTQTGGGLLGAAK